MNRQQGNGDSGRFVQRRGSWKTYLGPLHVFKVLRIARRAPRRALLGGAMLASRMLVRVTQNIRTHHSAGEAVPSPHPTASLRSAGTLLIQSTSTQHDAASWTSFEANTYGRYISHGVCTVRDRNHRPIAWCDQRARLARIASSRTLLTAHPLRLLRGAFSIESRHRSATSCSATRSCPRCLKSSVGLWRRMAAAWRPAAAASTRLAAPPRRLSRRPDRRLQAQPW